MRRPYAFLRAHAAKLGLLAVLSWPLAATFYAGAAQNTENRHLAPAPALPSSWSAFLALPAQTDAWINDHFGMRAALVALNNHLRFAAFREFPSIQMAAGRNGRLFLAAHGTNVEPYSAATAVCGGKVSASPGTTAYFNQLFADVARMGFQPKLLIVPSAPVVYSGDMPAWLTPRCAASQTAVTGVLNDPALSPAARAGIFYPLEEARRLAGSEDMFPKTWFHWAGPALGEMARLSLEHFWGPLPTPGAPLPTKSTWMLSDVNFLFPGVELSSLIVQPDLDAAHIAACYGPQCFPEFAAMQAAPQDVSRFHNPAAPPRRLLIISDSFGSKVSAWYARYYGEVEQVATNSFEHMSDADLALVRQRLFRDAPHTDLLLLYHDGGAVYNTLKFGMQRLHQQAPAVLAQH
ncbi:hypothetical protein GTP38_23095 [Duganella sp. FT94W]|uniref:AlgX/AlgJ SGNH hydrolase-like domain-containing protein n=1 Tax=Duganella lactea TaxID=2692173 RepID=A0ABW9VCQ0_9BURK|nr:hypothetical protein [Duganella lactea]MYM37218.1 hypothetical protein [Duganella lactea]